MDIRKHVKYLIVKKSTLRDWIKRYNTSKNLTRRNRKYCNSSNYKK